MSSDLDRKVPTPVRRRLWLLVDGTLVAMALAIVLSLTTGTRVRVVRGTSMATTLPEGTVVLVGAAPAQVTRGDVLLFRWSTEEDVQIKRAVALAGDTVTMLKGLLRVNGRLPPEPYASRRGRAPVPVLRDQQLPLLLGDSADYRPSDETWGPLVVPAGTLWMLGDNRAGSIDSRHRGPAPLSNVQARALASLSIKRLH